MSTIKLAHYLEGDEDGGVSVRCEACVGSWRRVYARELHMQRAGAVHIDLAVSKRCADAADREVPEHCSPADIQTVEQAEAWLIAHARRCHDTFTVVSSPKVYSS